MLVAGAAAQIAREGTADFILRGIRVLLQEWDESHQDAGRAITALQTVRFLEGLLQGVKVLSIRAKAFDGGDDMTFRLDREHQT